jgi:hypothetical protein
MPSREQNEKRRERERKREMLTREIVFFAYGDVS